MIRYQSAEPLKGRTGYPVPPQLQGHGLCTGWNEDIKQPGALSINFYETINYEHVILTTKFHINMKNESYVLKTSNCEEFLGGIDPRSDSSSTYTRRGFIQYRVCV